MKEHIEKEHSLASITQMLFIKFKASEIKRRRLQTPLSKNKTQQIHTQWMKIIHRNLYKNVEQTRETRLREHPYLRDFLHIIKEIPVTVNYNFDDSIEKLILINRDEDEKQDRCYETISGTFHQCRRERAVIYHPNGVISEVFNDNTSEYVTFLDEAFADQLIHTMHGRFNSLLDYYSKNTCLFVGISLEDATLRHLLRQCAKLNPGHYHYFIHYTEGDIDPGAKAAIMSSNFDVYNLITLFLSNSEIASLARLIRKKKEAFHQLAQRKEVDIKYCFYVIGPVGVGKSTAISHLKSLTTYDEWFDERLQLLAVPDERLTPEERLEVDEWIADQFYRKNWRVCDAQEGIHVVDRTPLDPLTFGDEKDRKPKAKRLLNKISPSRRDGHIQPGHVIFLTGEVNEIYTRLLRKHKLWPKTSIRRLQRRIAEVYQRMEITEVSTRGRSVAEVVKEIAGIIHNEEYRQSDLHKTLLDLAQHP